MLIKKTVFAVLLFALLVPRESLGDGWRFWKRKSTSERDVSTAGPVEKQTINRAQMDRDEVEKQIRDAQRQRAREEKKRQDDMARAQRKREREMARKQRDVERQQKKLQREQQKKLKDLSRRYEGKKPWKFWKRSSESNDFFLPQSQ